MMEIRRKRLLARIKLTKDADDMLRAACEGDGHIRINATETLGTSLAAGNKVILEHETDHRTITFKLEAVKELEQIELVKEVGTSRSCFSVTGNG